MGCVAIELLTGHPPFYEYKNVNEVLEIIKSGSKFNFIIDSYFVCGGGKVTPEYP